MPHSCSWPCRVERGSDGLFHLRPIHLPECKTSASTLEDAIAGARTALTQRLSEQVLVIPPFETFTLDDLQSGRIVRIDIVHDVANDLAER